MQRLISHPALEGSSSGGQSEAKVWILAIHYDFSTDAIQKRPGNARDLELLQNLFKDYHDCTFKDIASLPSQEIPKILSEDGIISTFINETGPPTVFMLFIFSHGDENGVIYTDQNDGSNDFFTIYNVWDALASNFLLKDCLKINLFGSCRGNQPELGVPPKEKNMSMVVGENSTCIIGPPNEHNFINFFAAVESTTSHTIKAKGSFLVLALDRQLRGLEKDVDVFELMRRVQNDVLSHYTGGKRDTPQISIFPHRKTHFCAKLHAEEPISSNAKKVENGPLGSFERDGFYPWCSINQVYKRGPALIFSEAHDQLTQDFETALKELEFCPLLKNLSETEETLRNISTNGLMSNEGSLFVVVIASIEGVEEKSATGLTVALGGKSPVPIGHLTKNFVTSRCTAFAGMPRVFIFIDPDVTANYIYKFTPKGVLKLEQVPEGNNHAGFLVFVGFGKEIAACLIQHLQGSDLRTGGSYLQEKLSQIQTSMSHLPRTSSTRLPQIWSTMPLKLDFPRCKDSYVPHNFHKRSEGRYNFGRMVDVIAHGAEKVVLITAPPGLGKSRASEEIHTQLVLRMSGHSVLYVKLSRVISFWIDEKNTPTVKGLLLECVDESKFLEFQQRLDDGKMIAVLDGFDEICPNFRTKVITLIKELLVKGTKVLITSRPQEKDKIIKGLEQEADITHFGIEDFVHYQKVLMLQTRLNLDENRCEEILGQFGSLSYNFTNNPMHLQMISETEDVENIQEINAISIYEQFLSKKIKHGLLTCRQIEEDTGEFYTKRTCIYSILTKCAVAQIVNNEEVIVALDKREVLDINLSGVATVVDTKSQLFFVHQTFAEFLTARHFMQMCFEPPPDEDLDVVEVELDVRRLFQDGVSDQTMSFIDSYLDKYTGKEINLDVLQSIEEVKKSVFERICHAGMDTLYSLLQGNVFDGLQEQEWMLESHKAADYDFRNRTSGMGLFFYACCSSLQLAERLSERCPMLQLDDIDKLPECLNYHNKSRLCLEMALTRVDDWRSRWPRANFFENHLEVGDLFSTKTYEFVLENCPDLDDNGLLQIVYSRDFNRPVRTQILPILLRLGADLTFEKNGIQLSNMIFGGSGDLEILEFAIKVAKHFQTTDNVNSEESLLLRKNVGAKSPEELGLDSSSQEGRGLYFRHILERACALLDSGSCDAGYSFDSTDNHEYALLQIRGDAELRPISTSFKLLLMRGCVADEEEETLKIFQSEEKFIPRDFKYRCGCSLVHDACFRGNLPLLEALVEKGFTLTGVNNKGETPLHRSVYWQTVCTEVLLKDFLGKFYVPIGARHEDIVPRTPGEQKFVEEILGMRDAKGRTPLLAATHSRIDESNAELLICNLLGPWLIPLEDGDHVLRTESEQEEIERILGVRDADGFSPLHGAVESNKKLRLLRLMLKNLPGEYFIDCNTCPRDIKERNFELQQKISQLLHPRNKFGVTPLLCSAKDFIKDEVHKLLLRNLLGEYFVDTVDGTSLKSEHARTEEENQFVRDLLFGEDAKGCSLFSITKGRCDEDVKLLIEANASYLLQQPILCNASFILRDGF